MLDNGVCCKSWAWVVASSLCSCRSVVLTMDFEQELDAICCKVASRVERDTKLAYLSMDADYWRLEQYKFAEGQTYAILAPFINTQEMP